MKKVFLKNNNCLQCVGVPTFFLKSISIAIFFIQHVHVIYHYQAMKELFGCSSLAGPVRSAKFTDIIDLRCRCVQVSSRSFSSPKILW